MNASLFVRSGLFPVLAAPTEELALRRAEVLLAEAADADIPPAAYLSSLYFCEDGTLVPSVHLVAARIEGSGTHRYRSPIKTAARALVDIEHHDPSRQDGAWIVRCQVPACSLTEERPASDPRPELCRNCRSFALVTHTPKFWRWAGCSDVTLERAAKAGWLKGTGEPGDYDPEKDPGPTLWRKALLEAARHFCAKLFATTPAGVARYLTQGQGVKPAEPEPWAALPRDSVGTAAVRAEILARSCGARGLPYTDRVERVATAGTPPDDLIRARWKDGRILIARYSHRAAKAAGGEERWLFDRTGDWLALPSDYTGREPEPICWLHGTAECECPRTLQQVMPKVPARPMSPEALNSMLQVESSSTAESPPGSLTATTATPPSPGVGEGAPSNGPALPPSRAPDQPEPAVGSGPSQPADAPAVTSPSVPRTESAPPTSATPPGDASPPGAPPPDAPLVQPTHEQVQAVANAANAAAVARADAAGDAARNGKLAGPIPPSWIPGSAWLKCRVAKAGKSKFFRACALCKAEITPGQQIRVGLDPGGTGKRRSDKPVGYAHEFCVQSRLAEGGKEKAAS